MQLNLPRLISIHAPVKGATLASLPEPLFRRISIHAPVKGATFPGNLNQPENKFQSTLP